MEAKVIKVFNDTTIQLDRMWTHFNHTGALVKIAGLIPGERGKEVESKKLLEDLLVNEKILITNQYYVANNILIALVEYQGKPIQFNFPDRCLPLESFSRWDYPSDYKRILKVSGGIPAGWVNPIARMDPNHSPFFRNTPYPTKRWERDYEQLKQLADKLFSDSHANKEQLDIWFDEFINEPREESAVVIEGEIGIGKSWYLAKKLMSLPEENYNVIILDLRHIVTEGNLVHSLNMEIDLFLNYYIKNLKWLYPKFMSDYGDSFNPNDNIIMDRMRVYATNINLEEKNYLRLHYYSTKDAPQLILAFDNIDQFTNEEQDVLVDYCRRLVGGIAGVHIIMTIRPHTTLVKSRMTDFYGEANVRFIQILCPNIFEVLRRRLITDRHGNTVSMSDRIPGTGTTWELLLNTYAKSDNSRGSAGFVRDLCSTSSLSEVGKLQYSSDRRTTDFGKDYYEKLDIRYYLKLFKRILFSNNLKSFDNIGNRYFGVQALMIHDSGRMEESESFLFNLFDNELPHLAGNALIRYRVLEYFKTIQVLDSTFDEYFDALGYGSYNARKVLQLFIEADLVDLVNNHLPEVGLLRGILTIPGERHFEIVTNLWYIICVKTGMNIYEECIKYGEEAMELASTFIKGKKLLNYYGNHGWVPETLFINFIADQEHLEALRIKNFLESNINNKLSDKISNLLNCLSSPAYNIFDSYHTQMKYWIK
jgi:hypothetical protein